MNSLRLIVLLALNLTATALCFAAASDGGNDGPNGGDEIGIQFEQTAREVLRELNQIPQEFPQLRVLDLEKVLAQATVIVVDYPLYAALGKQESVALNSVDQGMIYVNRARWKTIQNELIRRAIALHEVLGLARLESTGAYPLSSRYLHLHGLKNCSADLCISLIQTPQAVCEGLSGNPFDLLSDPESKKAALLVLQRLSTLSGEFPVFHNALLRVIHQRMHWYFTQQRLGSLYHDAGSATRREQVILFSESCRRGDVFVQRGLFSKLDVNGRAAILLQGILTAKLGLRLKEQPMNQIVLAFLRSDGVSTGEVKRIFDSIGDRILNGEHEVFVDMPVLFGKATVHVGHEGPAFIVDRNTLKRNGRRCVADVTRGRHRDPAKDFVTDPGWWYLGWRWAEQAKALIEYPVQNRKFYEWRDTSPVQTWDEQGYSSLPMYAGCSAILPRIEQVTAPYVSIEQATLRALFFGESEWAEMQYPKPAPYRIFVNGVFQSQGTFPMPKGKGSVRVNLDLW